MFCIFEMASFFGQFCFAKFVPYNWIQPKKSIFTNLHFFADSKSRAFPNDVSIVIFGHQHGT